MVKRQKEKQYQSAREQRAYQQLRSGSATSGSHGSVQRKLPFDCCALTLTQYKNPVCIIRSNNSAAKEGSKTCAIYDNAALMEFVLQHQKDPISGESKTITDIVTLHMDQDEEGRWQCPVLTKPFADHTKIVAVLCKKDKKNPKKKEAYVYSFEAYKELNVKPKNWFDLTTGDKFSPKEEVLILNDPDQPQHDITQFWHIQNARKIDQADKLKGKNVNVQHSVTATRIMDQIKKKSKAESESKKRKQLTATNEDLSDSKKLKIYADDVTGVKYTSGATSSSFTSTSQVVSHSDNQRLATHEEILESQFRVMKSMKEKGYVRLVTNRGDLLIELHCDIAPRTCTNFLGLCEKKSYHNTKFHRLIPKFMIQGGKPSGEGVKEQCLWGPEPFKDEFDDRLKHEGRGIVSMANAGPNTNKQQFFITFKSCPHLDRKHSIFGKIIDGIDILKAMEGVGTDKKDRPLEPITILDTDIISNPAKDAEAKEIQRIEEKREFEAKQKRSSSIGGVGWKKKQVSSATNSTSTTAGSTMIGKYLPKAIQQQAVQGSNDSGKGTAADDDGIAIPKWPTTSKLQISSSSKSNKSSTKKPKTSFGDFSGW